MNVQRTINQPGEIVGMGLQTGEEIRVRFKPAPPDTGIVFQVEGSEKPEQTINASIDNIVSVQQSTVLGSEGTVLHTVEHLLASLWALKIDNIYIEISGGNEVPILDGSCYKFIEYFWELGLRLQPARRLSLKLLEECAVGTDDRYIRAYPADTFSIEYEIEFDHPVIKRQRYSLNSDLNSFFTEIAPARTFGFLSEIKKLRKKGYLKGGSLQNAIVIGRNRVLNPSLRFKDEFVRHKILDAIGDLYLLGHPLIGRVEIYRGGHSLHVQFLQYLLDNPAIWRWETQSDHSVLEIDAVMGSAEASVTRSY